jgi:hypothetical protein
MRIGFVLALATWLLPACGDSTTSGIEHNDATLPDGGAPDTVTVDGPPRAHGPTQTDGTASDVVPPADGAHDAGQVTRVTVVMASDIAEDGRTQHARANATLVTGHNPPVSAVILGGDNARYNALSFMPLRDYYDTYYAPAGEANWGQFDTIAFPQLGNHEYTLLGAQGYFDYFATRMTAIKALAGYGGSIDDTTKGYYSFDLNGWHFVSLNSNCGNVAGGCAAGSAQDTWLKSDLQAHAAMPLIGVWHAPRYACGGSHGDATETQALWADLYDAHADFVFTGHNHYYERWKPLNKDNPQAAVDTTNGVTQVVVGSYGVTTYGACTTLDPRVERALGNDPGMGTFFLTLGSDGSYSFEYQLVSDGSIFDSGSGMSHHL